jgi:hypothetical protein
MTGGPIEGHPMTSNGEGRPDLPFLGRHGVKASPTSTTTMPRPESTLAGQAAMTIMRWQVMPRSDDNLPRERQRACREATQ